MANTLPRLWDELHEKMQQIWDVAEDELPEGTPVNWSHGGHVQAGVVIRLAGTVRSPDVWVRNTLTGNRVRISLENIRKTE